MNLKCKCGAEAKEKWLTFDVCEKCFSELCLEGQQRMVPEEKSLPSQTVDVGKLVEALGEIKRRSNQFLNSEESSHSHAFQMIVRTCEQALESVKRSEG